MTSFLRILNGLVCVVLVVFAAVQYNDPDYYLWIPVYAVSAAWTGMAAYDAGRLRRTSFAGGLVLCMVAAVVGTVWLWPTEAGFWHREVWWESETAREGMGMMVVTVALLVAALTALVHRHRPRTGR